MKENKNKLGDSFSSRGGDGSQGIPTDGRHREIRKKLVHLFENRPMIDEHLVQNFGLYMRSSTLANILLREEAYKKIISVPGDILVFGLWYGQDIILFENLRAIYEPYNTNNRSIIGFDTFSGYPEINIGENDVRSDVICGGGYDVPEGYDKYLDEIIDYHTSENAVYHPNEVITVKGNVMDTVPAFFNEHPELITALAYFDMALYQPTKVALDYVLKTCVKGSVIVFDEFNRKEFPGETIAAKELIDLKKFRFEKSQIFPDRTYLIID